MLNKNEIKIIENVIKRCKNSKENNIEQEEICAIEKLLKSYNNARERNKKLKTRCKYIRDEGEIDGFISGYQKCEKEKQEKLKKKDKIINLAIEVIAKYTPPNKDFDFCSKTIVECQEEDKARECEDCIKQYFERKVDDIK